VLSDWFAEANTPGASPTRPPWACRGWFAEAIAWIRTELRQHNRCVAGPVEQLRAWERSALLRAPTEAGWVYFKAVPAMFAHEPVVTQALAAWFPGAIPGVIALDPERRWLLLEDFGGATLDRVDDPDHWAAAIRGYARLQVACVDRIPDIRSLGCPAWSLPEIAGYVARFVADTAAFLPGQPDGLTEAEIERLQGLESNVGALLGEIAAAGIPLSLQHGDFGASNIAVVRTGYVFFDWSDCAITHPFFDLSLVLDGVDERFSHDPTVSTRLREAYLDVWTRYAPIERLRPTLDAALRVAPLVRAMVYHHTILPGMGDRWEMEAMAPHLARRTIEAMAG